MSAARPRTIKRLSAAFATTGLGLVMLGSLGPWAVPALHNARAPLILLGILTLAPAPSIYRRYQRSVWRRMGLRGFSYCGACNYPFDEQLHDDTTVTCSECRKRFRAGTSRVWFRDLAR